MSKIELAGKVLNDKSRNLSERFRALFMLKNFGGDDSVDQIARCLVDPSDLLNHELAYCLGQMQNKKALKVLHDILADKTVSTITRHESAEAIGALSKEESINELEKYCDDDDIPVAETCQLAVQKIKWNLENKEQKNKTFSCVDPTPSGFSEKKSLKELEYILLDKSETLFDRYRAMFALRDLMTDESATSLAKGLHCDSSALFRHEIGFVLGQMQNSAVTNQLVECVKNVNENPMVRHECAEALGSIANEESLATLREFLTDSSRVVRESCEVALDMYEYEKSENQFHYAVEA